MVMHDDDVMRTMHREANAFAMELLIPELFIRLDLEKMGHLDLEDEPKIEKLARRYKVSRQVMTIRLGQILGL
jgi:Zn-dependent peptidase ImmA (M78 family)